MNTSPIRNIWGGGSINKEKYINYYKTIYRIFIGLLCEHISNKKYWGVGNSWIKKNILSITTKCIECFLAFYMNTSPTRNIGGDSLIKKYILYNSDS